MAHYRLLAGSTWLWVLGDQEPVVWIMVNTQLDFFHYLDLISFGLIQFQQFQLLCLPSFFFLFFIWLFTFIAERHGCSMIWSLGLYRNTTLGLSPWKWQFDFQGKKLKWDLLKFQFYNARQFLYQKLGRVEDHLVYSFIASWRLWMCVNDMSMLFLCLFCLVCNMNLPCVWHQKTSQPLELFASSLLFFFLNF